MEEWGNELLPIAAKIAREFSNIPASRTPKSIWPPKKLLPTPLGISIQP